MVAQLIRQARSLRIQGFSPDEIQSGLTAIHAEGEAERARLRATPAERRRRRKRYGVAVFALCLGLYDRWYMMTTLRIPMGDGTFQVKRTGIIMAASSAILIAVAIIQVLTDPARESLTDWLSRRIFAGRLGRWFFRATGWRMGTQDGTPAGATPSRHGALTLLDTLQGDDKKRLGKAKAGLERLEGEIERLERREKELESALIEARVNAPTLPGGPGSRQQALLDDLERARGAASERRVTILGALENIRLSLVRVKSRIGTADDTEHELGEAIRLLDSTPP
jgi:DNA repair exonuclease SbcCD ATPase subunit